MDYDTTVGDIDAFPGAAPRPWRSLGGTAVAGTWTLHAYDDTGASTGAVPGWSLTVTTGCRPRRAPPTLVGERDCRGGITDVNLALDDLTGHAGQSEFLLESPDGRFAHVLSDFSEYDDPRTST